MTLRDVARSILAALVAAVFVALVLSLGHVDGVPTIIVVALLGLSALAAFRPELALLGLAALLPLASWLWRRWNPGISSAEALVVAVAAGYCLRGLRRQDGPREPLTEPLLLATVIVSSSLAVQLLIEGWRAGGDAVRAYVWQLITADYFLFSSPSVDAAMRLLESLVLVKAAAEAARRVPDFALRFSMSFVFGAAAAAAVNLLRIWEGALRQPSPLEAFGRYLLTIRFNAHYGDVNAAGSYFVMALFLAVGLALVAGRKRWSAAAVLIGTSIWVTGSRAAMISGLVALLLPAAALAMRIRSGRTRVATLAVGVVALMLLTAGMARFIPERGNQQSSAAALQVRWELARTSLRMLSSNPAFGVGIGEYPARSGEFSSPQLLRQFPPAARENAHNNFLQIGAELGIVGLLAIGWILAVAAVRCARLLKNSVDPLEAENALRWGMATGLLAFVLSWLAGHPLLIDEPAFTFWLLLGVACGWGATANGSAPRARWSAWIVTGLAIAVLLSISARFERQRDNFDLEHRGVGLSEWQDAIEGVRYRLANVTSGVFVPASAQTITVPLRAAKSGETLKVDVRLDGRSADVIAVPPDRWYQFKVVLPHGVEGRRFHRLEFHVMGRSTSETGLLMIGKVEPR